MKPVFTVITGLPGSGKTVLADKLAEELRLPYIDYDTVCQPFLRGIAEKNPDGRSYADFCAFWRGESYGTILGLALHNLGLGISVILSAPLTREKRDKGFFRSLKERSGVDFFSLTIDLQPDEAVVKENMEKRASDRDIEKLRGWDSYYAGQDRSRPLWDADRILIPDYRNGRPIIEQVLEAYPPHCISEEGRL